MSERYRPSPAPPIATEDLAVVDETIAKISGVLELMAFANALIERHGPQAAPEQLLGLGYSEHAAHDLVIADETGRYGFPPAAFQRIEALLARFQARRAALGPSGASGSV